jgi:hypothetical protein
MSDPKQDAILAMESQFAVKDAAKAARTEAPPLDTPEESAEIAEQPEPKAPVAAPEEEEEHDEDSATSADGDDPTARPRKNKGVGKRINELTREKHEALRRAEAVEQENAYFRQLVQQQQQGQQAQQPSQTQAQGKPTLEAYGWDQEAYAEALTDWKVDQRFQALQQDQQRQQYQTQQQERQGKVQARIQALEQEAPGAWEAAISAPINYTPSMLEAIAESEIGPKVGYYLSQHLDEAAQISRLSPFAQAVAMGRVEAKLSTAPPPKPATTVTRAPAPAPGLPAGTSATAKMDSIEDHMQAVREKLIKKRNQG